MTLATGRSLVRPADEDVPAPAGQGQAGVPRARPVLPAVERRLAALPSGIDDEEAVGMVLSRPAGGLDHLAVGWAVAGGHRTIEQRLLERGRSSPTELRRAVAAAVETIGQRAALTVAEALALRCHQHGLAQVFAYPGTSELALCHAFGALGEDVLVNTRGDAQAVFMAGGAGMTGSVAAVAVLHGARGLTNATGAIGVLRRNELPALVVVGLPSTSSAPFLPPHGEDDLIGAVGAFAKDTRELSWSIDDGPMPEPIKALDEAIALADRLPRGPVLLGVPQDVLEWRGIPPGRLDGAPSSPATPHTSAEAVAQARLIVERAARVVILVDDYLFALPGAADALAAFADAVGGSVLQVRYRRGPMLFQRLTHRQVPAFLGWYDPLDADHRRILGQADLLVTVEDRNLYERVIGPLPGCRKLAVTSDARKARKNGYLRDGDQALEGSPVTLLRLLAETSRRAGRASGPSRPAGRGRACPPAGGASSHLSAVLAQAVRGCLDLLGGDVVVDDSQMLGGLLADSYDEAFGTATVRGDHSGFVGAGVGLAAGLAVSSARPVLCLLGDQGLTNGFQGLVAAAQEAAAVLYVVANNGESVSLRKQSTALGVGAASVGLDRLLRNCPTFDYVQAAAGVGVVAERVDATDWQENGQAVASRIVGAAERSWRRGSGPALVEIVLPSLGPAWDGVWDTRGHDEPALESEEADHAR